MAAQAREIEGRLEEFQTGTLLRASSPTRTWLEQHLSVVLLAGSILMVVLGWGVWVTMQARAGATWAAARKAERSEVARRVGESKADHKWIAEQQALLAKSAAQQEVVQQLQAQQLQQRMLQQQSQAGPQTAPK